MKSNQKEVSEPTEFDEPMNEVETIQEKAESVEDVKPEATEKPKYWEEKLWKGVVPTLRCLACGHCDPDKNNMVLHVITHVEKSEQENLFNQLVKEM